jgi:nucleoid-associated protein YgaU
MRSAHRGIIALANGIGDPETLRIGQKLELPRDESKM